MKFVSIPDNGSSWRGRLPYSFTTESDQPQDVTVEILDATTRILLGSMRLYGVTEGVIDVAPYILPHVSMMPMETVRQADMRVSPSAIGVVVRLEGVESEPRAFFRSQFDYESIGLLSSKIELPVVQEGDTIRLTLFAQTRIDASVVLFGAKSLTVKCEGSTYGLPMELVIPTKAFGSLEKVSITVRYDSKNTVVYNYTVLPRCGSAQRLVWYNTNGGVESFLFDHAMHLGYSVDRADDCMCDDGVQRVDGRVRYRLCSGYELQEVMERVAELMLSPVVCREVDGVCRVVDIESKEINYDSKGMLHTISLDLSEEWKGGKLW